MRQALILCDSTFGNTEQVARAIAEGLRDRYAVRMARVADAGPLSAGSCDLLVVGGPTQRRHMSPGLRAFVESLRRQALRGTSAATFDTRYRVARFLSGSAARDAAKRLRRAGCRLIAAPESFFMDKDVPPSGTKRRHQLERLQAGELDRARTWARSLPGPDGSPA